MDGGSVEVSEERARKAVRAKKWEIMWTRISIRGNAKT